MPTTHVSPSAGTTGSGCTNALRIPVAEMNEAVLQAIEAHALTPEAVAQVIRCRPNATMRVNSRATLQRGNGKAWRNASRDWSPPWKQAGDVASLAAKLRELEARRSRVARLRSLRPVPRLAPAVIEDRLAEWRRLLRQSTTQARAVLQRVLNGRINFTPPGIAFLVLAPAIPFEAPTRFDKLFTGIAVPGPAFIAKLSRPFNRGAELHRSCRHVRRGLRAITGAGVSG